MKVKSDIEILIAKYLLGNITTIEKSQLDNWLKSSPLHKELFNRLLINTSFRKRYESYTQINSYRAWKNFQKKYCSTFHIKTLKFLKYTAILILPIIIVTGGWYFYSFPNLITNELAQGDAIQPGIVKATLISADKKKKQLTREQSASIQINQSTTATIQDGTLVYPPLNVNQQESPQQKMVENNTLTTEQGNEFKVIFEDGTSVHLNYNTEIRYPIKFSKTKRLVYLKGEAYFKIAKDNRPFYIITDQSIIKQYGTEFNVNTFTPKQTEVALVKGHISITSKSNNQEHHIRPGQLACITSGNDTIAIHDVDLTPYIAWNEGRLIFDNRPLENIVRILEHWYNVNISFSSPELGYLRFTGNMDRYSTITPILKAIARTTNLQIKIDGREILITDN